MTDADGVHPISLGPLPDPIAKLIAMQVNVQQLAVEAAVRASKEIALQALLIDPVGIPRKPLSDFLMNCGKSTVPISDPASDRRSIPQGFC